MANLKEIRTRISSVQSTRKITAAMKMISAAKLRRAQERVQQSTPYSDEMSKLLTDLVARGKTSLELPKLLLGTGRDLRHLFIFITSERGLCGGFNTNLVRYELPRLRLLREENKQFDIICVGKKSRDLLRAYGYGENILKTFSTVERPTFRHAQKVAAQIIERFDNQEVDICDVVYNRFESAIKQVPTSHRLIPYTPIYEQTAQSASPIEGFKLHAIYEYEPSATSLLDILVPRNLAVQIYRAMIENNASEHGARMAAMDGSTRNADDMIKRLKLNYNRTRQAMVTKELIEIISGAEAL